MPDINEYVWIVVGVFVAVIHPVLLGLIRKDFPPVTKGTMPPWLKKYGGLFLFCALTGVIVLAIYKSTATNPNTVMQWYTAFLLGYGWEAFIEKWQKQP